MKRKDIEKIKTKKLLGDNIMTIPKEKLVAYVQRGINKNKSYERMARESGVSARKISKIGRDYKKEYIRARTEYIAARYLAGDRPSDIARGLGISRQLINDYLNKIVWEDYDYLNKLEIEI